MLSLLRNKQSRASRPNQGFTLVEIVIIAPIVILVIGAFITIVVSMTGEVLAARGTNVLAYNIQDALDRIEQDVKVSGAYLATNNITLSSPQGYNDDTTAFHNADATQGTELILNAYATTQNPVNSASGAIYTANQPNACGSTLINYNPTVMFNIIYFVKNGTLWRRTVMPANYATMGCSVPWQQPSCAPTVSSAFCKTQDIRLVDGIGAGGFNIGYYPNAASTSADPVAGDATQSDSARFTAMSATSTIGVTITSSQTIAGRDISQTGVLRVTGPNSNAGTNADLPVITSQPSDKTAQSTDTNVTFSTTATGKNLSVQWQQSTDGGTTWANISGATSMTLTLATVSVPMNLYKYQAIVTNSDGATITTNAATLTVTATSYTSLVLQNAWANYGSGYATAGYIKTSDSLVMLKGLIASGVATSGTIIATLPLGYRPANNLMFTTETNSNVPSRVDINPDGTIRIQIGSNGWLSLDGINFLPTGSPYAFTPMTLSNGWVNYGGSWQTAGYTLDGMGRTHIQGLIANGSTTSASLISSLPAANLPSLYQHLNAASNNSWGFIAAAQTNSTYPGAGIQFKGGSNAYLSLNNMFYTSSLPASGSCPSAVGGWCNLTLQTGWVWYSATGIFATPQYTKSADGVVTLKGLITGGTGTIATLPVGYRPAARLLLEAPSNSASARVDIDASGNILFMTGSNTWFSLDGINFLAEQ